MVWKIGNILVFTSLLLNWPQRTSDFSSILEKVSRMNLEPQFLYGFFLDFTILYLAAMSSSRSDEVTQSVRYSISL